MILGGGASQDFSIGWLRGEGVIFTVTTGVGVGGDVGFGVSLFAAYNENSDALNMQGYLGQDWETVGQFGIGLSWSGDLGRDPRAGKRALGINWQTYELSVGMEASGYSKVNHTYGFSWKQLMRYLNDNK